MPKNWLSVMQSPYRDRPRSANPSRLSVAHPGVEVWPDEGFSEGGWSYAWIVARSAEGTVRNLAYVRLRDDQLQHRTYDDAGDDLWLPAE